MTPGADEEVVDRDAPRPSRAGGDDHGVVDEQRRARCRRPARRCRCSRPASPGSGSGPSRRPPPPRRAPRSRAGSARRRRCRSSIVVAPIGQVSVASRGSPRRARRCRFRSTTIRGRSDPSRSRMIRSVPPARSRASGPCSAEQGDGVVEMGRSLVGEGSHGRPRAPDPLRRGAPAASPPGRRSRAARRTAARSRPAPRGAHRCRPAASGSRARAAR